MKYLIRDWTTQQRICKFLGEGRVTWGNLSARCRFNKMCCREARWLSWSLSNQVRSFNYKRKSFCNRIQPSKVNWRGRKELLLKYTLYKTHTTTSNDIKRKWKRKKEKKEYRFEPTRSSRSYIFVPRAFRMFSTCEAFDSLKGATSKYSEFFLTIDIKLKETWK